VPGKDGGHPQYVPGKDGGHPQYVPGKDGGHPQYVPGKGQVRTVREGATSRADVPAHVDQRGWRRGVTGTGKQLT
jgi:hypothetical protein